MNHTLTDLCSGHIGVSSFFRRIAVGLAVIGVFVVSVVSAQEVVVYRAGEAGDPVVAPSPADSGWVVKEPTSDVENFRNEAVSPDGATGLNGWRTMDDSSASGQFVHWRHSIGWEDHQAGSENGWVLSARMRVADTPTGAGGSRCTVCYYGNGSTRWLFYVSLDANGKLVTSFTNSSNRVVLDDLDVGEYHLHQLVYDGVRQKVDYLVNGVVRYEGVDSVGNSFSGVQFGNESSPGKGDAYWNEVTFRVVEPVAPPVAEPGAIAGGFVEAGEEVVLASDLSGAFTEYQWFKDGVEVPGATDFNLSLDEVEAGDGEEYVLRAKSLQGAWVSSDTMVLGVLEAGAGLRISEFMAAKHRGMRDEDGERVDWIEIFNADTVAISTEGWAISDDVGDVEPWELPGVVLEPGEFRIIYASGKDRRVAGGEWHADFSLSADGEELVLRAPGGVVADHVIFGAQYEDVSYGRTWGSPAEWRYFYDATPLGPNRDGVIELFEPEFSFSPAPGVFVDSANVEVGAGGVPVGVSLYYTVDGSRPDFGSAEVTGPISITKNTQLRVAAIAEGERYGVAVSANYFKQDSGDGGAKDISSFSSPLPLVILSNIEGGAVPGVKGNGPYGDGSDVVQVEMQEQVMTILDGGEGQATTFGSPVAVETRLGVRQRGSSSFDFPRKSYRLETWGERGRETRNLEILGMPKEHDWVLYAPSPSNFDRSLINNAFAYELARRAGFNAPRFRFVEVFLDVNGDGKINMDDHRGLYLLVESVKRDSKRVDFEVLSNDGAKGGWMLSVDRMDRLQPGMTVGVDLPRQFHTAGPNGYLETDDDVRHGSSWSDDQPNYYHSFFNFSSPNGWEIFQSQRDVIQAEMRAFDAALYGANFKDPELGWASYIDARNWAEHLAIHHLTRNQDAAVLSSYLYKKGAGEPIRWASIWDFDRSCQAMGAATSHLSWGQDRLYYARLFEDAEFKQVYLDTWQDLRRGAYATDAMMDLIDELAGQITPEVAARSGLTEVSWQGHVNDMKAWLADRAAAIDAQDPMLVEFDIPGGPVVPGLQLGMSVPSGTIYFTEDGSDPRERGGAVASGASVYSSPVAIGEAKVVMARVRASSGKWSGLTVATFFPNEHGPRLLVGGETEWDIPEVWEGGVVPNGSGQAAIIGEPDAKNRAVEVDVPVTLGALWFDQQGSVFRNRLDGSELFVFDSGGVEPALLKVSGTGEGFVEFNSGAGYLLGSDLVVEVDNLVGDAEYGALRLRREWSGAGGMIKAGVGMVSLTGDDKNFTGAVLVQEGVLQVTGSSFPANSASLEVRDGGQLRLNSSGMPQYGLAGDVILAGNGRGSEVPEEMGYGKLGALRYEPGSAGNIATVVSPVVLAEDADVHVAKNGVGNQLVLEGGLSGTYALRKSGGGTLTVAGVQGDFSGDVEVVTGELGLKGGNLGSATIHEGAVWHAAGQAGDVMGEGVLRVTEGLLVGDVSGVRVQVGLGGDYLPLQASGLDGLAGIEVFADIAGGVSGGDRIQGGIEVSGIGGWGEMDWPNVAFYVPDEVGSHEFDGRLWSPVHQARATRNWSGTSQVLEFRFDGKPLDYVEWALINGSDLAAFALRGDLTMPKLNLNGDEVNIRFPYDAGLRGVRWVLEYSSDLEDWGEVFDSELGLPEAILEGDQAEVVVPMLENRSFFRLRLEEGE